MAEAFRSGNFGIMDYYKMKNMQADSATRRQRGGPWLFPSAFVPAPLQLLRNNGNGTFTDITRAAKLDRRGHVIAEPD